MNLHFLPWMCILCISLIGTPQNLYKMTLETATFGRRKSAVWSLPLLTRHNFPQYCSFSMNWCKQFFILQCLLHSAMCVGNNKNKISVYIFYFVSSEFLNYERYFVLKVVLTCCEKKNGLVIKYNNKKQCFYSRYIGQRANKISSKGIGLNIIQETNWE